jgi:hypothetical protein
MFMLAGLLLSALSALPPNVQLQIQPDEARAVLAILDKRAAQQPVTDSDWQALTATEGYTRLKKRELSMKRDFSDEAFRDFVMSDALMARRNELHRVVNDWLHADLGHAAGLALAYLPKNAPIRATIYPVIKPASNSFVFEGNAIFKYVSNETGARFENVVAHELHHIGFNAACGAKVSEGLPEDARAVSTWLGAFGEGMATLAAAGGPGHDAEATNTREIREEWARGLAGYDADFRRVEQFFLDVADEKITGDAIDARAFGFFGGVGPWYSVGYVMAVTIERELGRKALIEAFCEPRQLLVTYNRAVTKSGRNLPAWSPRLIDLLSLRPM